MRRAARRLVVPLNRHTLKDLAAVTGDPVVSWYLDVDGRHRPRWTDVEAAVVHLARRARRLAVRLGVEDAVERQVAGIERRIGEGVDRSTVRGLALFSSAAHGLFREVRLGRAVRDQVAVDRSPRIAQLEEALEAEVPFVVVLADGQRCRFVWVQAGLAVDLDGPHDEPLRAVDVNRELGGFDHHDEEALRRHLRRCAAALRAHVGERPAARVLVGGTEAIAAELERCLEPAVRARLAGRVPLPATATTRDVVAAAEDAAAALERQTEEELVEELRQRAATGSGGAVGLQPTLEALEQRRVATLLVARDFDAGGGRCPTCGWIGPDLGRCPRCATGLDWIDNVVEVAIDEAAAQQAGVIVCDGNDLDRFGHIGAIKRF